MKKIISLLVSVVVSVSVFSTMGAGAASNYEEAAAAAEDAKINYSRTIPIEVKGNKIVEEGTDNLVVLRGVNAVSYTHLDVYKRQAFARETKGRTTSQQPDFGADYRKTAPSLSCSIRGL